MSICLMLIMAGSTLLPVSPPAPDTVTCEMRGAALTDGQTVRGYVCLPVTIYDCREPAMPKRQRRME